MNHPLEQVVKFYMGRRVIVTEPAAPPFDTEYTGTLSEVRASDVPGAFEVVLTDGPDDAQVAMIPVLHRTQIRPEGCTCGGNAICTRCVLIELEWLRDQPGVVSAGMSIGDPRRAELRGYLVGALERADALRMQQQRGEVHSESYVRGVADGMAEAIRLQLAFMDGQE